MFERFTAAARESVTGAQAQARELHHAYIGTEHLLLSLLAARDRPPARVLNELGLDHAGAVAAVRRLAGSDDLDAAALGTIGIDLAAVREKVEATFGPGALDRPGGRRKGFARHIPFTPAAKKALELSLREAIRLKHNHIADGHIMLGLIREDDGMAMRIITEAGISGETLRDRMTPLLM
ncbi:Clp protease N-terminal domain-containing protein [Spongiactinospora sp. TRM90649]|uniref:Clp protease N-terminal domain-containing protein n=1 Tax=Spongiactinospora sp. TRM90649 TaxID=3031114 RepID=UPI0023F9C50C|nr:Clp protease N-terminal domain-containing protein [Spongiactinospora sp. TRM90649]MDF5754649.1 Clp protease N-terminal domain-containing protein [Spongiactinospora sp. TRM90649]